MQQEVLVSNSPFQSPHTQKCCVCSQSVQLRSLRRLRLSLPCEGLRFVSQTYLVANSASHTRWMTRFGKSYTGAEYARRLAIFEATVAEIAAHKAKLGE